MVGEFAIFSDEPRRASVIAVGRVKALVLTRDKYMELYQKSEGTTLHVRFVCSFRPPAHVVTGCCDRWCLRSSRTFPTQPRRQNDRRLSESK